MGVPPIGEVGIESGSQKHAKSTDFWSVRVLFSITSVGVATDLSVTDDFHSKNCTVATVIFLSMSAPLPLAPFIPQPCMMGNSPTQNQKYRQARGQGREALVVAKTLGDFEFHGCPAWKEISQTFGDHIKITHLRSLAVALHYLFPEHLPRLSRTENRRFSLIIKWFDQHWTFIAQVIQYVSLTDDNFTKITVV
jgi:hypothetical protein